MQRYCTELTERLLKSLDKEYNVVDMAAVVDVITALEKTTITKEVLEITRLGKYINELRRKTSNDALAKRAKVLLRRWRNMVLPQAATTPQPTPADTAPPALNGAKPQSPALRGFKPQSPALRGSKPQSPISRDISTPLRVLSPALSVHSENSHSPITTPNKQHQLLPPQQLQHQQQYQQQQQQQQQQHQQPPPSITVPSNHRISHPEGSPKLRVSSQNHLTEAVPRTHSSNKRLRKDENQQHQQYDITSPINETESLAKRQRLNGENSNSGISCNLTNAQVPIVTLSERISEQFVEVPAISKSTTITTAVTIPSATTTTTSSTAASAAATASTTSTTGETEDTVATEADNAASGPKKRGRKKGSKSVKKAPPQEDSIKEKLASVSRNPKIKTTQELLADIRARGSSNNANFGGPTSQCTEPPRMEDVLRDSDEQVSKYLRSHSSAAAQNNSIYKTSNFGNIQNRSKISSSRKRDLATPSPDSDALDGGRTTDGVLDKKKAFTSQDLTVEEILAKLPPLDPSTIEWSDHDEDEKGETDDLPQEPREISTEDLDRLHSQCIEGLNGNWQPKLSSLTSGATPTSGSGDDNVTQSESDHPKHEFRDRALGGKKSSDQGGRIFREWHEMLARPSYDGQILHILPYVIID